MATLLLVKRPEIVEAVAEQVRQGVPASTALRMAGVSAQLVAHWRVVAETGLHSNGEKATPETIERIRFLFEAVARAEDDFAARMVSTISRAATSVNLKTGIPEWRAADCLLSKHPVTRENWYEHREVQVEHTGDVSVRVAYSLARSLSDGDLLSATDAPYTMLPHGDDTGEAPRQE